MKAGSYYVTLASLEFTMEAQADLELKTEGFSCAPP